jgi:hypothetical protein
LAASFSAQENTMNEICEKADTPGVVELSIDELDVVNGGCKLGDVIDRLATIYHYVTGTITSHATTLP